MARNRARVTLELVARNMVTPAVNAAKRDLKGLWDSATSLKGQVVGALGSLGVGLALNKAFGEADALAKSFLRLTGSSKITGVAIRDLQRAAEGFAAKFNLSTQSANDFTAEVGRLVAKSGDVSKLDDTMAGFLNLAAARGYSAEDALVAVRQAILGIDEGTDKLFGVNPSQLWKEYADSIGIAVGAMDDQQKAQALVWATLRDSQKVGDSYLAFLKTGAGASANFGKEANEAWAAFGDLLEPLRVVVLNTFASIADGFEWFANGLETTLTGAVVLVSAFVDYFKWFASWYVGTIGQVAAAFVGVFDKELADSLTTRIKAWQAGIAESARASLNANRQVLDILRRENAGERELSGGDARKKPDSAAKLKAQREAAAKAHKEAVEAAIERAKVAEDAMATDRLRLRGIIASRDAEKALQDQLALTNTTLEERVELEKALASLRAARNAAGPGRSSDVAGVRSRIRAEGNTDGAILAVGKQFEKRGVGALPTSRANIGSPAANPANGLGANILINLDEQIANTRQGLDSLNGTLYDISLDGVAAFRDAFIDTFAAIVDGSQTAGQALGNVAIAFLGTAARKFGDYFMAQSIAAFAASIFPVPNPANAKAGAGYLAGAGAMYALAGASAGATGRNPRGGGGSSRSDGFRDNLALPGNRPGDAVLSIEGGLLDMGDHRQREAMRAALEALAGRRVVIRGSGA